MKKPLLILIGLALIALPARADSQLITNGDVWARLGNDITLGNGLIQRDWAADQLGTEQFGAFSNYPAWPDFTLQIDGVGITSMAMQVDDVRVEVIPDGLRIVWTLLIPDVAEVTRTVEAVSGVGALRSQTTIRSLVPLHLGGYTLDEVPAHLLNASATVHDFRAGADWRYDDDFDPVGIGDNRTGHWRRTTSAGPSEPLTASGQWIELVGAEGAARAAIVAERRHAASSVATFDGTVATIGVDFSRDIAYTGPFEEQIHVENPAPRAPQIEAGRAARTPQAGARARLIRPGEPLALEPAVTLIGTRHRGTEWGWSRYLDHVTSYPKAVTFNTNGVDSNAISTGAKDDVNHERVVSLAEAARAMGVETFILDDGWQALSGDWCPDSPQCPEPRWDGTPDSKFAPRFLDDTFSAVREVLAGDPDDPSDDMELGLWWTPMAYHPMSEAFQTNPQWSCAPVGTATGMASYVDDSSSFEPGIGLWNTRALGVHPDTGELATLDTYLEDRIARAIEVYGATYFKFDFLVWMDCLGVPHTDAYDYHDDFVAMLDRLRERFPDVTFQIDETNDYRMFPFESVVRGPSWFQNGKPRSEQLLHNIWNLAPWVPGHSLGQHAASNNGDRAAKGVDSVMAVALGSHITFWNEIDEDFTSDEITQIRKWTDFYKAHRDTLTMMAYPLLEDPLDEGFTALQPWDPYGQHGWLLVYRQDDERDTISVPMRAVAYGDEIIPNPTFTVTRHDPADGSATPLGTFTDDALRAGLSVTIDEPHGYALLRIARA